MNATLPDTASASEFFADKIAFTTGPVELDRARREGKNHCVIVDVRAAKDYAAGHIPGAVNFPEDEWDRPQQVLERDCLNVLYCYSQVCHLAAKAAARFAAAGYPVQELEGGFKGWEQHQLEVER